MTLPDFISRLTPDQRKPWETQPMAVVEKQVIVSPDLPSNDVFYVLKGEFEVTTYSERGKIVFYRIIGPGDLFGELAAIDDGPRSATVRARAVCTVPSISMTVVWPEALPGFWAKIGAVQLATTTARQSPAGILRLNEIRLNCMVGRSGRLLSETVCG